MNTPVRARPTKKPATLSASLSSLHNYSGHVWTAKGLCQAEALVTQARESGVVVKGQVETTKKGPVTVQVSPNGMVTA